MGLLWRHHSRYYITAWENGPYLVMERHWWKDKHIAQFDYSLQGAIWYVQDLEPNATISIIWYPRGIADATRPVPKPGEDPTSIRAHIACTRRVDVAATKPESPITGRDPTGMGKRSACGQIEPGDTVIALAKPARTKYAVRRMNARREMEDV
jgi:hypothetical protein